MWGLLLCYARANVLIGRGGERATLYRLQTVAYPFVPVAEKWRWLAGSVLPRRHHLSALRARLL